MFSKTLLTLRGLLPIVLTRDALQCVDEITIKIMLYKCFLKRVELVIQCSNGGRSFQARRPACENARLPISVQQCGLMYWSVSAYCRPDLIWMTAPARTMPEGFVGHLLVWIECIMGHTLQSTRRSTGNQWNGLRARVTCSFVLRSRISRAAAFWTRWSGMIADFGRPAKTEFLSDRTTYLTESTQLVEA